MRAMLTAADVFCAWRNAWLLASSLRLSACDCCSWGSGVVPRLTNVKCSVLECVRACRPKPRACLQALASDVLASTMVIGHGAAASVGLMLASA